MSLKITFDKKARNKLLILLGKRVDKQGYIIDSESKERAIDIYGEEIKSNNLGAIVKGSFKIYPSDIDSVLRLIKDTNESDNMAKAA